jgi:hypothetical protein
LGKRPFVRFYHLDWKGDGDVEKMSMQEVGTYWTLLVRQMVDRSIESDFSELQRCLNVRSNEEVDALITPRIRKKFHTSKCVSKTCAGWTTCNIEGDDTTRLFNRRLVDVIVETDNARDKGFNNANKGHGMIRTPPLEASLVSRSEVEETPSFDFGEILKMMPKRRVKGQLDGWDRGKEMLKYITTQEEYNDLLAATRSYAKTRKGEDPAFHISLFNWVSKGEYQRFVPARSEPVVEVVKVEEKAEAKPAPAPRTYPTSFMAPPNPARHLAPGQRPPWMVDSLDFEAVKRAKELFPDDDSKRKWWMTPEIQTEGATA